VNHVYHEGQILLHETDFLSKIDNVTSAMCKHQQRFGLHVQISALVLNFNNIFSNGRLYQAGQSMNSPPEQATETLCAILDQHSGNR
jgi:hypothetical protein